MAIYQVNVRFNNQNLGSAVNVFWFEWGLVENTVEFLDDVESWVTAMYGPMRPYMDGGIVFASAQVNHVNLDGSILEIIGNIAPTISGQASGDSLALTTAASLFARTNTPKVRGSKRLPGITEAQHVDGLFLNPLIQVMTQFLVAWIIGPSPFGVTDAEAGVLSSAAAAFVAFNGSGVVTNIPGTQVTRKPLRGQ